MALFSKQDKRQNTPEPIKPERTVSESPKPVSGPVNKPDKKAEQGKASAVSQSVIAEGTVLNGEVESDRAIVVYGTIKGKLDVRSDLIVAETGLVEADVDAENVSISGRIKGRTVARNLFELKSTGVIEGEIIAKSVKIDEGGRMIGKIDMQQGAARTSSQDEAEAAVKKKKQFLRAGIEPASEKEQDKAASS